jgi:hypothetical protein
MPRACVFCGAEATLTNAHVLSQPIRAAFSGPSVTGSFIFRQSKQADGSQAAHSHPGGWVDVKARAECGRCNAGWTREIEESVSLILPQLIKGQQTALSIKDQQALASWSVVTIFLLQHTHSRAARLVIPASDSLRQDAVLGSLDEWLAGKFEPCYLSATIDELAAAAAIAESATTPADGVEEQIAACDRRLAQYRAALDAGADPASVAKWITETEAQRARLRPLARQDGPRPSMTREEIESVVTALADMLGVLRDAEPADKADIYARLGLKLTYQPADQVVRTEVNLLSVAQHWSFESVRGGT